MELMEFVAYVLSLIAIGAVFILWIEVKELKDLLKRKPTNQIKQTKPREPINVKRTPGYFDKL